MPERPARKRSRWRILLLAALVCVVAAYAASLHPAVRAHVRRQVVDTVQRDFGLVADIGSVEIGLSLTFSAYDVSLRHPEHGLLARVSKVVIAPSLRRLLRGELKIKRVAINGAEVRLRVIDGVIVNLPKLAARKHDDGTPEGRLPLRELTLHGGRFVVDAAPGYRLAIRDVDVVVRVADGARLGVRAALGSGIYTRGKITERLLPSFVTGRFSFDKLEIDSAKIETTLGTLAIKRAALELPYDHGRYRGDVSLSLKLDKLASLPSGDNLPALDGEVSTTLHVDGTGARYHALGTLHGENPSVKGFGFGFLDLKIDATPDEVQILRGSQGNIVQEGGLVLLEGKVGLSGAFPIEAKADFQHLEFHKLMAQLGVTDNCVANWVVRGGFKLSGTGNPVDVKGPIAVDSLSFKAVTTAWHDPKAREVIGTPPGHVRGRVVVRPDALRFENLVGKLPHSELRVMVHVGFAEKLSVTAHSDALDLRDATGLMGMAITGKGPFDLEVGGTYRNTTLTGDLDLSDFSLDGFHVGQMKTHAVLEKDGVAVRFVDTAVRKNESRYTVDSLLLDFSEHFTIDANAHFERLSFADFYHSVKVDDDPDFAPYQGRARGTAVARYTLGFPGDDADGTLRVDTDLTIDQATVYGLPFEDGDLSASYVWHHIGQGTRGAELELRELTLAGKNGRVAARGAMGLEGKLRLTVFGEELALSALPLPALRDAALDGEVGFVGPVRGSVWVPEAALSVNVLGARFGPRNVGDGALTVHVSHRDDPWVKAAGGVDDAEDPCAQARAALSKATWLTRPMASTAGGSGAVLPSPHANVRGQGIVVCTRGFGQRFDADAVLGLSPELPLRGTLAFRDVPVAWFLPRPTPADLRSVGGTTSGSLRIQGGALNDLDSLAGHISLSTLRLGGADAWLASEGPIEVALTGRGASIQRAQLVGRGTRLRAFGGGGLREGLRLGLEGRLDLSVLPSLTAEVTRAAGSVDLAVKVSGAFSDPSVFGHAEVHGGSLLLKRFAQPVDDLSAILSFSEHELQLESARANVASGVVTATGSAAIDGPSLGRYEIALNAEGITLEPMSGVDVAFSADTVLRGRKGMLPELSGTIRLQRAVYKRPVSLGLTERLTGLSQARRTNLESYDPTADHVTLDLRVVNEGPLRVQNNLLTAELTIADRERPFRIVGTDQRTGVLGTIELVRGTLTFRNTQFLLDSGTVTFLDETRLRSRLDLSAHTEFRRTADASGARWLISLSARGDTDNLKIETSSSPALAQEDIALLLTVGLTRAEAERLGTSQLTQGAALEALASVTGVDREVKKALPVIDDFTVTSAYSARTNRTEPQVVVGKRISERMRASATTGLTADSNFKAGVQWRFNDQTAVEAGYDNVQTTTSSQFGNVGVDLRWRLEFD